MHDLETSSDSAWFLLGRWLRLIAAVCCLPVACCRMVFAANVGVAIDGVDASTGSGAGWTFVAPRLSVTGTCVLSGSNILNNVTGDVRIVCASGAAVTLSNLVLVATNSHAFDVPAPTAATVVLVGSNTFTSTAFGCAGVHVPSNSSGVAALVLSGPGTLVATGASGGAGIGGGTNEAAGRVTIDSGTVTARSVVGTARGAAGLGGGGTASGTGGGAGGVIVLNGGTVLAQSGSTAAIGGYQGAGIGGGYNNKAGRMTVKGGCIRALLANGTTVNSAAVSVAVSNGTSQVFCVAFTNVSAALADVRTALAVYGYGTNGLSAVGGNVYAWLPSGVLSFIVTGAVHRAVVVGVDTAALRTDAVLPVLDGWQAVPGTNAATGTSWTFGTNGNIVVSGPGPVVAAGSNSFSLALAGPGAVAFVVSNLVTTAAYGSALNLLTNRVTVTFLGTNILNGASTCAGIHAASNRAGVAMLTLGGTGSVSATGGENGAGIGGNSGEAAGRIAILGGTVQASGGNTAAGIGGGLNGSGGVVTISNGLVTAVGGTWAAGIGGGFESLSAGWTTILGGTIVATGHYSAGIGGGAHQSVAGSGNGGTVVLTGGNIMATTVPTTNNTAEAIGQGDGGISSGTRVNAASMAVYALTFPSLSGTSAIGDLRAALAGYGYGTNGLNAVDGTVVAYLTNGAYAARIGDSRYTASIANAAATAGRAGFLFRSPGAASGLYLPFTWITNKVSAIALSASDAVVSNSLAAIGANGLAYWKSYALGLDPASPSSVVLADALFDAAAESQSFCARNVTPPVDDTFSVLYVLAGSVDGVAWTDLASAPTNAVPIALPVAGGHRFFRVRTDIVVP